MRIILRKLREARQRDEGFTLIELLIVILILGVLAGIAIFASGPFRDKAAIACEDANTEIGIIHDAAVDAGVTGELYAQGPGDCAGGSGSGGAVPFAATLVNTDTGAGFDPSATTSATADNLLVAIVGHRTTPDPCGAGACDSTGVNAPTAAGWTYQGHAFTQTSTADRRGIAVFTKIATGSDSISVSWTGAGTMNLIVKEFSRDTGTWSGTGTFVGTEAGPSSSPYALDPAAGGTGSALQIAGVVGRTGPSTGSFTGFDETSSNIASSIALYMGSDNVTDAGDLGASFVYGGTAIGPADGASGFVLFLR